MNRVGIAVSIVALGLAVRPGLCEVTPVRVKGERVNLRARASLESEVVGQASSGQELSAKSISEGWVEIIPPEGIDLWVHRDFLSDGSVTTKRLNIRAGPGINYTVVGSLDRGEKISIRGEFGEWFKIAPPPACSLWVNAELVELVRKPAQPPARRPVAASAGARGPVQGQPRPVSPPTVVRPPVQIVIPTAPAPRSAPARWQIPADWDLVPLEGQGKTVEREGYLRQVGFVLGRPSRFRLVQYDGGRAQTVCFVEGDRDDLAARLNERLLVRGREYWLQNATYPVVVVEQVSSRPEPIVGR